MKYISYAYFILPAVLLIMLGILNVYIDYSQIEASEWAGIVTAINYGKSFIYTIYPGIGYIIIVRYMRSCAIKGEEQ